MRKNNKLGEIPYEKSNNVEYSLFQKHGRITRMSFLFRLFLGISFWLIFHMLYMHWAKPDYIKYLEIGGGKIQSGALTVEIRYKTIQILDFFVIPSIVIIFLLIQGAKRMHDVNKSGWFLFIPFYNLYLLFSEGTDGHNDFGLMPHPEKKSPRYFDNLHGDT